MVEANSQSKSSTDRQQTTPESEKPRVQLELKSNTSPAINSKKVSNNEVHIDLLKKTVA